MSTITKTIRETDAAKHARGGGDRRSKEWCSREGNKKAGNPLYAYRSAMGLTQAELGERLHTAQVHISAMERGTRRINEYVTTWLKSEGWL